MFVLPHVLAIEYPVYSVVAYYGKVNGEWWSGRDIPEALLKANEKLIQIKPGSVVFGLFQDWVMDWQEMPLVKFLTGLSWVLFYLFVIIWILEKIGIYLWMKLKVFFWGIPIAMHGAQGPVMEHIHMNELGRARNYHHLREEREDARL